jgi:hypothetical protein
MGWAFLPQDNRLQLLLAALAGGIVATTAITLSNSASRKRKIAKLKEELKEDIKTFRQATPLQPFSPDNFPEELIREQLSRNYSFLGEDVGISISWR